MSHEDIVEISCIPPASQRLLWCQESLDAAKNAPAILPRSKLVDSYRIHYVLVNTNHNIRLLILDPKGRASLSHRSIVSSVKSSNEEMAQVQAVDGTYDRYAVQVFKKTGRVTLSSVSTHYRLDMLSTDSGTGTYFGGKSANSKLGQSLGVDHAVKD